MAVLKGELVSKISRDEIEEITNWLASRVAELIEESFGDRVQSSNIKVQISDEWPYIVEVEAIVKVKYPSGDVDRELASILDKVLAELATKVEAKGFKFI